jgi:hypothetical protein
MIMFKNVGEELFYRTSSQAKEQLMKKVDATRTATSMGNTRAKLVNFGHLRPP